MLPGMKVYELPRPASSRGQLGGEARRGGALVTRSAARSLGLYFNDGHGYEGCLRHLPPEGPKQALNDRMPLV